MAHRIDTDHEDTSGSTKHIMAESPATADAGENIITQHASSVLTLGDIDRHAVEALLARYALRLEWVADDTAIPGSFWGECEAGLISNTVYARRDTPVHSLLHEACHLIVLTPEARAKVHTNATQSQEEEDAVCILQVLLGDTLPGVGRNRILADMDAWGYHFRLGSARAYFEQDSAYAWRWLENRGLLPDGVAAPAADVAA
jgi:hypothetical protein